MDKGFPGEVPLVIRVLILLFLLLLRIIPIRIIDLPPCLVEIPRILVLILFLKRNSIIQLLDHLLPGEVPTPHLAHFHDIIIREALRRVLDPGLQLFRGDVLLSAIPEELVGALPDPPVVRVVPQYPILVVVPVEALPL